uniref:Breast carcinoma amplified sequence 1 n=1 Tax=Leptobrachium leishanense TaxID=445787 RepID=A0A8C5QZN2_9ANUR
MQEPAQVLSSDTATKRDSGTQTVSEGTQTTPTEEVHPIMSFFKTLVSPNKPVPKSEEEAKNEGEEKKKDNGKLRKTSTKKEKSKSFSEQTLEADAKGLKKSDSPKSGTLSRLFRQKSKKEEQQASGNKISMQTSKDDGKATKETAPRPRPFWRKSLKEDQVSLKQENTVQVPAAVSVSVNVPPQQILIEDPNPKIQTPITAQISNDEGKNVKDSTPRPLPFWRKSFKADPPPVKNEEYASAEPDVQVQKANTDATAAGSGTKTAASQDKAKKTEDGKNAKPKLMTFFKQLTLDITDGVEVTKSEKTVVSAVIETPSPKNKENMKEKKVSAEKIAKQDSRESPEATGSIQLQMPEASVVVNGSDAARESQLKRTEKRQSLGSFFKAIGPKRMCDAEVQTDPVSILPAEKVK